MRSAQLVREARRRAGLTQAELAARAGTTQSAIARLEAGRIDAGLNRVTQLVRLCGFELDTVLYTLDPADWAAIERNLKLTPEQRWDKAVATANFVVDGRKAVSRTTPSKPSSADVSTRIERSTLVVDEGEAVERRSPGTPSPPSKRHGPCDDPAFRASSPTPST